jgi:hypothetical protein
MRTSAARLLALALIWAGCTPGLCARSSDCATGRVCTLAGACVVPADASVDGAGAGEDATVTKIGDASIDAPDDAPDDAPPDAPPDAAIDAPPDAVADAVADAVIDAPPDAFLRLR